MSLLLSDSFGSQVPFATWSPFYESGFCCAICSLSFSLIRVASGGLFNFSVGFHSVRLPHSHLRFPWGRCRPLALWDESFSLGRCSVSFLFSGYFVTCSLFLSFTWHSPSFGLFLSCFKRFRSSVSAVYFHLWLFLCLPFVFYTLFGVLPSLVGHSSSLTLPLLSLGALGSFGLCLVRISGFPSRQGRALGRVYSLFSWPLRLFFRLLHQVFLLVLPWFSYF